MSTPTQDLATQGEVVEGEVVFDPDFEGRYETDWDYDQAHAAEQVIQNTLDTFAEDIDELMFDAFSHRVWIGLGYESWEEWRGTLRRKPTNVERKALVNRMHKRGMSTRAIGAALGISNKTAHRDIQAAVTNDTPDDDDVETSEKILGSDGKEYKRDRKKPAAKTTRRSKAQISIEDKQRDVMNLAMDIPWSAKAAAQILEVTTEIIELMKEAKK